jgi:hypothetical protein
VATILRVRGVAAALLLATQLVLPVEIAAASASPAQTVDTLHSAINTNDLESSSALFADDAVVIQPRVGGLPQIYVGRDQIGWWVRNLAAQHTHWTVAADPQFAGKHVRWSDMLSMDAFREQGLAAVAVDNDVVLNDEQRIESLTTVFTPQAARNVQFAPVQTQVDVPDAASVAGIVFSALLLSVGFGGGAATVVFLSRRRQHSVSTAGLIARAGRLTG